MAAYWATVGLVRRQRGERMAHSFIADFIKQNGHGRIHKLSKFRVDSLNNFFRLWALEVVSLG